MRYIYTFGIGVVLVILMFSYSCRPKGVEPSDNEIEFDTIRTVRNYYIDNDSTQPSCNLKLAFVFPSAYKDETKLPALQDIFITCYFDESCSGIAPQSAVDSYVKNYIESYKEDVRTFVQDSVDEHDAAEIYVSYYEIDDNTIEFNKSGILSFQISQTNYKGGTSSYDFLKNYVVDLKTMRLISETDLYNEGYERALGVIFRDYLMKTKNVKNLMELENIGYFGLDEMIPNGNFLLDEKGITYIFNKGEYSGYKTEPIKIFISYNEIAPLIKENAPISKFLSL